MIVFRPNSLERGVQICLRLLERRVKPGRLAKFLNGASIVAGFGIANSQEVVGESEIRFVPHNRAQLFDGAWEPAFLDQNNGQLVTGFGIAGMGP